jgi:hypothetical protein
LQLLIGSTTRPRGRDKTATLRAQKWNFARHKFRTLSATAFAAASLPNPSSKQSRNAGFAPSSKPRNAGNPTPEPIAEATGSRIFCRGSISQLCQIAWIKVRIPAYNQEPMGSIYSALAQTLAPLAPDALTRLALQVMVADRASLGLPDLTVVDLQDFLKAAEDPTQNPNILSRASIR